MESGTINGIIGAYTLVSVVTTVCAFLVVRIAFFIKRWRRRRKTDARIIAQAKAAGVWDKKPIVLGGRALELKAWEDFKIKREPGETDAKFRRRYSLIDIATRKAEEHGLKMTKVETDGYIVNIILCDEQNLNEIKFRINTEAGGKTDE